MPVIDQAIPGYAEAIEKEARIRSFAFCRLPEKICGIEIQPLTPRLLLTLELCESPFVVGGIPTKPALLQFLWVLSPHFQPNRKPLTNFHRWRLIQRGKRLDLGTAINEVKQYLAESMMDAPGGSGGSTRPYFAWPAVLAIGLSDCLSWKDAMDTPLKVLFQLMRAQMRRNDAKAILVNQLSDKVISDWLAEQNQQKEHNDCRTNETMA